MEFRLSVRLSLRPSVRPSVNRVNCDKKEENSVQMFIPHERSFSLVFLRKKRMIGESDPFYLKFWVNRPRWSEIADFEPIIARSASAVTHSKKVELTLIGSPLRAFQ